MSAHNTSGRTASLKRSHSDMRGCNVPTKWIDEEYYRDHILRLPAGVDEDQTDQKLEQDGDRLGIGQSHEKTKIETITTSLSGTTLTSDPAKQGSIMSQSTAPTSCSSSEHRPVTGADKSQRVPPPVIIPSITIDMDKKRRNSGFRNGIRKMAGLSRRRKPFNPHSPSTTGSVDGGSTSDLGSVRASGDLDDRSTHQSIEIRSTGGSTLSLVLKSPSTKSTKSFDAWPSCVSVKTKSIADNEAEKVSSDQEAVARSTECSEMTSLRREQLDQRQRLLDYQAQLLSKIHALKEEMKAQRRKVHETLLAEQNEKNNRAIEEMEIRQLEDELRMRKEHETDKLKILTRLRHMEAYCQSPSPPSTPIDASFPTFPSGSDRASSSASLHRGSIDSAFSMILPERKITDRDYHNLAASYRERDAMDNLHASRINVLRGRQKRAVENFVLRKERDIEKVVLDFRKELDAIDLEFAVQEAQCRQELRDKKQRLEQRWKLQSLISKTQQENATGLKYELLPEVTIPEDNLCEAVMSAG